MKRGTLWHPQGPFISVRSRPLRHTFVHGHDLFSRSTRIAGINAGRSSHAQWEDQHWWRQQTPSRGWYVENQVADPLAQWIRVQPTTGSMVAAVTGAAVTVVLVAVIAAVAVTLYKTP